VARVLVETAVDSLRFYPDPVCSALRERIAEINGCLPDQVFVGNGSDEVLRLCMRAFTQPGGAVASFSPSYSLYPVLAEAEEVEFREVSLGKNFGWADPPDDLDASVFFLANPNAPTGVVYPKEVIQGFCERFSGVVVLDEAYIDFSEDENSWIWAQNLSNTLVCRTLSKSFSLAGLRLGYALGSAELMAALFKLKDSYNVDRLAQTVALAALGDLAWMQDNARRVIATRKRGSFCLASGKKHPGPLFPCWPHRQLLACQHRHRCPDGCFPRRARKLAGFNGNLASMGPYASPQGDG